MARIEPLAPTKRGLLKRLILWVVRQKFGEILQPLFGYAHSSAVFYSTLALELGMERARRVDDRLSKLAELRVAALVGCPFCLDFGSSLVAKLGVPERQLRELHRYETSDAFDDLEKAVLRYTDRMTRTPVAIDDDEFGVLRQHFNEAQIVELSAAIALENLRARLNHALGYGSQGFAASGVCALAVPPESSVGRISEAAA